MIQKLISRWREKRMQKYRKTLLEKSKDGDVLAAISYLKMKGGWIEK